MSECPNIRSVAYCCYDADDHPCVCSETERFVRAVGDGHAAMQFTPEQREWCLSEIKEAGDSTDQADHSASDDSMLARAVIRAWRDDCRDKGML